MKTLDAYMQMKYPMEIIEDEDEGGFVVSFPDLPGCLTCGETIEEALQNAEDAKHEWLTAALEDGYPIREPTVAPHRVELPDGLAETLLERAHAAGTSLSDYCISILSSYQESTY